MDDTKIVQLYWDRNEQAIPATADKYGNYCTSIAKNILGNREDAEECVNDTYSRSNLGGQCSGIAQPNPADGADGKTLCSFGIAFDMACMDPAQIDHRAAAGEL